MSADDCLRNQEGAEGFLKMKVNKKLLQQHLSVTAEKVITVKDISNIQQTGLVSKEDGNNLNALVKKLRNVRYINIIIYMHVYTRQYYEVRL